MPDNLIFQILPQLTKDNLISLAAQVTGVVPVSIGSFRVSTNTLDPDKGPREILNKLATTLQINQPYIYYVEVMNNANLSNVQMAFSTAKQRDKNLRYYPRPLNQQSKNLYVGSSEKIIQRIKEHLGYGSPKTYSLQLAHWANGLDLELDFVYAKYDRQVPSEVVQAIEDMLWDRLTPMFGRKGKR
jgi:hypothetical protein